MAHLDSSFKKDRVRNFCKKYSNQTFDKIRDVIVGKRTHLYLESMGYVQALEDTPFRGQTPMYELNIANTSFDIDQIMLDIAGIVSNGRNKIQSNIDSFDDNFFSMPLNFHFDRGASFTVLGCLRGSENKFTVILPFAEIPAIVGDTEIWGTLLKPSFCAKDNNLIKNIPIFCYNSHNILSLSGDLIKHHLEFKDICPKENTWEAEKALRALNTVIKTADQALLSSEIVSEEDFSKFYDLGASPICLKAGDILLLNNSLALHGRTAGKVHNLAANRWLRAIFLDY